MKVQGLAQLAALRAELRRREAAAAAAAAREQARRAAAERERRVFADAVGPVQPLRDHGRSQARAPLPEPHPRMRERDEQAALREALSDEVDVESLLLTDDGLSWRRPGVAPDVAARLRRGQWAVQAQLDLHGLRRDEARAQLVDFLRRSLRQGWRCVRVIHGKGHGSPGREPVLKARVQRWLAQRAEVIAFAQATGPQGGAGALIVLLQRPAAAAAASAASAAGAAGAA
ncbi:MAG: Smr/MutS family protein [Proteobacteria bacterium]|nr:Smr/MutS family protein [Pseudomonadota bacterium]